MHMHICVHVEAQMDVGYLPHLLSTLREGLLLKLSNSAKLASQQASAVLLQQSPSASLLSYTDMFTTSIFEKNVGSR